MTMRACEWPRALREVDTAPLGEPGRRWLCLHHAGAAWNARKQANRAAGRCPCAPHRGRARLDKRRARRVRELARDNGIEAPQEPGRRRALLAAFVQAFRTASRERGPRSGDGASTRPAGRSPHRDIVLGGPCHRGDVAGTEERAVTDAAPVDGAGRKLGDEPHGKAS